MTARILIGDSLGGESAEVLTTALEIGRATGLSVHVVHAFDPPVAMGPPEAAWAFQHELEERLEQELLESLGKQAKKAGLASVPGSHAELRLGSPHQVLKDAANEEHPGLIVVGSAVGGGRMGRFGSTTDRLLRQVSAPVWIVRGGSPFPPKRVLFTTDLSALSAGSLRSGAALLRAANIVPEWTEVLFVLDGLEAYSLGQFSGEQMERFAVEQLGVFVAEHGASLPPGTHRKVLTGSPREALLQHIGEVRPDLVVLGTHGRSGLDRLLLGSVASAVVREVACSALVIPLEAARAVLDGRQGSADWGYVSDVTQPIAI